MHATEPLKGVFLEEYATWNVKGSSLLRVGDWAVETLYSFETCALQEVGGLGELNSISTGASSLREILIPPDHDLSDFRVFGTDHIDSYLGQVILLERRSVQYVIGGYSGSRYVAVRYVDGRGLQKLFISVHFPHSDNADDSFSGAIFELGKFLREWQGICTIVAGDWNTEPGDSRHAELMQMFAERGFQVHAPTCLLYTSPSPRDLNPNRV